MSAEIPKKSEHLTIVPEVAKAKPALTKDYGEVIGNNNEAVADIAQPAVPSNPSINQPLLVPPIKK